MDNAEDALCKVDSRATRITDVRESTVVVKPMSLRLAICILCLMCVLLGSIASMVIVSVGSNKAVDDSLDLGDTVQRGWESVSLQSLRNTSLSLMDYSSTLVESYVREYVSFYTDEGQVLKTTLESIHASANGSDWNFWLQRRSELFARLLSLIPKGFQYIQILVRNGDNMGIIGYSGKSSASFLANGVYLGFELDMYGDKDLVVDGNGNPIPTPSNETAYSRPLNLYNTLPNSSVYAYRYYIYNLPFELYDNYLLAKAQDEGVPWWTPPTYDESAVLYYVVRFPFNGVELIVTVGTWLTKISAMLAEIATKVRGDTSMKLRMYTVGASNPSDVMYQRAFNRPSPDTLKAQINLLTGVSTGEVVRTVCSGDPSNPSTRCQSKPVYDVDAEDTIIGGVAEAVHNVTSYLDLSKAAMILNVSHLEGPGGVLLNGTLNETIRETFFVTARRANGTLGAGMDWWIVTALDTFYVQGAVEAKMVELQDSLSKERDTVTSDIAMNRTMAIMVVVVVCVLLIILANLTIMMMLRPFLALQEDMERVANMEFLTNKLVPTSIFHEVFTMQRSFFTMAQNLKEFKAYVPEAVLGGGTMVDPPKGNVAIVFTDIQGSTALWDRSPYGMNNALELHNETMREVCKEVGGYEVKTIGDAFMIAFPDATKGVQFCLEVQIRLTQHQWSMELDQELPQWPLRDGSGYLWNGLRVRMGCHYGDVILEDNPLTGRSDYRGTTVNTASRLEAKSLAGAVCVTESVFLKLNRGALGNPSFQGHGVHELKGLGTGHKLFVIVPKQLCERLSNDGSPTNSPKELKYKQNSSPATSCRGGRYSPTGSSRGSKGKSSPTASNRVGRDRMKSQISMFSKASDTKPEKKAMTGLTTSTITIAVCRISETKAEDLFTNANLVIGVVGEAALQTDGIVVNVLGRHITIAWNTAKPNKLHVMSAVRFASQLEQRYSSVVTIGLATGKVLHGNVGSVKSRFHNMYGVPLEMAEMLASYSNNAKVFALMADGTEGKVAAVSQVNTCLRIVDVWEEASTNVVYRVYEVMCRKLRRKLETTWEDESATNDSDEILEFNQKYLQVLRGSSEAKPVLQVSSLDDSPIVKKSIEALLTMEAKPATKARTLITLHALPQGLLRPEGGCQVKVTPGQNEGQNTTSASEAAYNRLKTPF